MGEHLGRSQQETYKHTSETEPAPEKYKQGFEEPESPKHNLESLETIRKKVEQQALPQEKSAFEKHNDEPTASPRIITKRLKAERYKTTLKQVRRHLSPAQKLTSKFVHQPIIETVSEVGAKTVARPSGLLGGGLVSLVGSLGIIIVAKRIGFEVPNSLFWILFLIGFLLGIIIELVIKYIKKSRTAK